MIQEAAISELIAKQAIADQMMRYCRSMDRCDHALGYSVFHPDAALDYGAEIYQGSAKGFVDWTLNAHLNFLTHSHQIANMLIEIDGDAAASETYVTMTARFNDADGTLCDLRSIGRYVDRWENRDGVWRIAKRDFVHETNDCWPVTRAAMATYGSRDTSDISYQVFAQV